MLSVEYAEAIFKEETVRRFIDYFQRIVAGMTADPAVSIAGIEIMSPGEKQKVLVEFNRAGTGCPADQTLHGLFEEQAERAPDRIAVVGGAHELHEGGGGPILLNNLTYRELNEKAGRAAGVLREKGVLPDDIVAIKMERSLEMIIAIFGILKAGGAYLPIDPGYPQDRIDYMLNDSGARITLTEEDIDNKNPSCSPSCPSWLKNHSSNLAYVIYTSGTTGKPKGTLTTHANAVRVVRDANYIDITPGDRLPQLSNYAFDGSVFDIFGALTNGAALVLLKTEEVVDVERLASVIKARAITCFFITTALFNTLVDLAAECLQGVRKILFGGELVSVPHVRKALALLGKGRLIHVYGPTETTVYASYYHIDRVGDRDYTVPIGAPISNTCIYILDRAFKPVPVMVPGELFIGGTGVARGYLNRPGLTAERFLMPPAARDLFEKRSLDPQKLLPNQISNRGANHSKQKFLVVQAPFFKKGPGRRRQYKTNDRGRWLDTGDIEFLGRSDHQVKIRGFRIEPAEIENCLVKLDHIKEALVTVWEDKAGSKHLCAYIVAGKQLELSQLRNDLAGELPAYMIPSYFTCLESFPLTPQGKIDRRALPEPGSGGSETYSAPRDKIEQTLANIWADILGLEKNAVGIDSGFFEMGGNSLKATTLKARVHKEMNVIVQLADIFYQPTIRALAQRVRGSAIDEYSTIEPVEEKEFHEVSHNQERLWILQQLDPGSPAYNVPGIIPLENGGDTLNEDIIKNILAALMDRHESLRTYFIARKEKPVQRVAAAADIPFKSEDISALEPEEKINRQRQIIGEIIGAPFNLERAPLLRSALIKTGADTGIFVFNMHHIISDGWSMEILKKEFFQLHQAYTQHRQPDLERPQTRYRDFARWQRARLNDPALKENAHRYWRDKLAHGLPEFKLPRYVNEKHGIDEFAVWDGNLPATIRERLAQTAAGMGTSTFMLFFAGIDILLARLSGQQDIACGLLAAGREHAALQTIVGFFVNTLILHHRVDMKDDFGNFLKTMAADTLEALRYQEYPLELAVKELGVKYPDIPVMFNMISMDIYRPGAQTTGRLQHTDRYPGGKFDLDIHVLEYKNSADVRCIYRKRLFRKQQIEHLLRQYLELMQKIAAQPEKKIEDYFAAGKKRRLKLK
jgi:amino acid adenylation domain-containing protein